MKRTVFIDVDTQLDFLLPSGSLYVPGAEHLAGILGKLTQKALEQGSLIISTADAHAEDDEEFRVWRPHCVKGTAGQRKYSGTLLGQHTVVETETDIPAVLAPQVILNKSTLDPFTNPAFASLLSQVSADAYFVYGLVTEYCVAHTLVGLEQFGKPVYLVRDAICSLNHDEGVTVLREFRETGGDIVSTHEILT